MAFAILKLVKYEAEKEPSQFFTNEKLYFRIPTSVDAIIITMQNGKYNVDLLTK